MFVAFGGSRLLPVSSSPLVSSVVAQVAHTGASVSVGCAIGADALVIQSALSCGAPLSVFCVGAAEGLGFSHPGVPLAVVAAACAGADVRWLAGGPLRVPIRARLAFRSRASVQSAAAAVFFVSSAHSRGSWGCAAYAASIHVPVFAFAVGFHPARLAPLPGQAGCWLPASFAGQRCMQWSPAQGSLF